MNIQFDRQKRPDIPNVYLGSPNYKIICGINGIRDETFSITSNLNNAYELSFEVDRYVNILGKQIESNVYNLIDLSMRIYVDGIGWFITESPKISNDGKKEVKSITAYSAEIEMTQHSLNGLKINKGTTDSYEMLVEGNVDIIDDVEFAKEQIKFCNKDKPELSFLHILLKVSGLYGWEVGYIDDIPKKYQTYQDGKLVENSVMLSDEIGTFEIENKDLYSFLTQDAAQFFSCVFIFDFKTFKINAYRPENLGKDTNIHIGFRNLQQSNEVTVDQNNIFTRYYVSGNDELNIMYVNFGDNWIENLDYFLNEKYMPAALIIKYKLWKSDVELKRPIYIEYTRLYNAQQNVITELHNRVPLDGCSTEWNKFTGEELLEAQANYQAQLKGYEAYYVDEEGDFDQAALDASSDADDYYQIKDVILPSVQIEIENRKLDSTTDPEDYIDSYKTDWKLYGLDELQVKLDGYKNDKKICEDGGYNVPYANESGHTEDMHNKMYEKYLESIHQLDRNYAGSCQEAFDKREQEISDATDLLTQYDTMRKQTAQAISKETWKNGTWQFTQDDLSCISHLYIDGDYTNNNMFLTSSDDAVSDEQLKLLNAAQDDLTIASQPQYIYSTNLDNFLAQYEYYNYTSNFNLGDFIHLGVRDEEIVKLRITSMTYNPRKMDNNLQITFSNMVQARAKRDDFSYLLGITTDHSKNTASGGANDYLKNEGIGLTAGLIQKLIASGAFSNKVNQLINNEFAGYIGKLISVTNLNAEMIKVTDIIGQNGFFEYLQAKLITADKIVADSGEFKELNALVANINNLLAGNVVAELGHIIRLTAENVNIDQAVIRDLIAANITVSMLQAGDISTDTFRVISDDGGIEIAGNTMQFKDKNNVVRIQIGRDAQDNFTFVLYDDTGKGVMIDSTGIKESALSDGLIKNDMIADATISKEKMGFKIVETDENGKVSITEILDANGESLGVSFTEIQKTVSELGEQISTSTSYFISIDNEFQNIPCVNNKVKKNILLEIPFVGYKGTKQTTTTVTVGVLPSGMTVGEIINATDTSPGKVIINIAKDATLGGEAVLLGHIPLAFTIDGKSINKRFGWTKTNDGNSPEVNIYSLECSDSVIKKTDDNTLIPGSVTFSSYINTGSNRTPYNGRFVIQESLDGATYANKYLSSKDESSVSYTPSSVNVQIVRCSLYEAGGIIHNLDVKSVLIITDAGFFGSEITEIRESVINISSSVDKNTNAISQKASQSDISTAINNYDNSTVKATRDQVAEHKVEIGKITDEVKDVKSTVSKKADGSTVTELSNKVSQMKQDADGFKQIVEGTYATKDSLKNYSTTTQMNTAISQSENAIKTEVSKTYETKDHATSQYSLIDQRAGKIESTVTNVKNTADAANAFATNAKNNYGYQYKVDVVVKGDANTYYPVVIKGGDQNVKRNILIARGLGEQAPDTWNTATHKGALTLHLKTNFGGWGGANYSWTIHDLEEMYCRMFAGATICGNSCMFAIFLRGGGTTGAIYHLYSDQSLTTNMYKPTADTTAPQICYNSEQIFLSGSYTANAPAPRTLTAAVEDEIKRRLYVKLSQENYSTIATVKQTAEAVETEVRNARGSSSSLAVRLNEIISRVSNTEDGYTELLQTAGTIQQSISGLDGRMSSVTSTASALQSRLTTAEGQISTVEATAKSLNTSVTNLEKNIGTKFQQTENSFTAMIQAVQNSLNNTLYKNFKFDANGITISSGNSNITLRVDNTGINFYNGSSLVAYINSNKLHITDATVVDNMQIGAFGYTQMSNGSLSFGKI